MKSLSEIFDSVENRRNIPNSWHGLWIDENRRQLFLESTGYNVYTVTILDNSGQPFAIDLLEGRTKKTINLSGQFTKDLNDNPILQIEAGLDGIGPTYNLYFLTKNQDELVLARNSDDLDKIIIKPNVGIGLYDDWEDDLGVPWAFPLSDFKKKIGE